jgi:hypothetical protein
MLATEYALLLNESYANGGNAIPFQMFLTWRGTNWQNEVLIKCSIINHFFSGGSDKITYAVSGSHLGQEGIIGGDKSGFLRFWCWFHLTKLKKTNILHVFNRKSLNEVVSSVLFNALNTLQHLHLMIRMVILQKFLQYRFRIEIINPLAQIANTYNDYNS